VRRAVVVADDDPAMRAFLSHALAEVGYLGYTAMDVRRATIELLRPGVVAAIIDMLFVNSGGRSGLDVLRFIREDPALTGLPVIVLTGFPLNRGVVAQIETWGAELWHKPFDPAGLTLRLDQLIERQVTTQCRDGRVHLRG
jgi:DNA-binding response OmpR family regulator